MKTYFLRTIFIVVCLGLACSSAWTQNQNKTQAYYNSHEREILPDARTAFKNGNYDRAAELSRWHWIIVGDRQADSLREMAERCGQLARQLSSLKREGKMDEAKTVAQSLLSMNPDDAAAKQLLEDLEKLEKAQRPVPEPVLVDTAAVSEPPVVEDEVFVEKLEDVKDVQIDPYRPVTPVTQPVKPVSTDAPRSLFVVKAGVTVLDLSQFVIAPGGSLGLYNLGGSMFGLEAGMYAGSGLAGKTASIFGMDAAAVLRVGNSVYPKVGVGFFSCKSSTIGSTTKGLSAVAGLTFLLGGHFAVEAGLKYYPNVKVSGVMQVSTAGATYDFPTSVDVLSGGIAPVVSIGWAF